MASHCPTPIQGAHACIDHFCLLFGRRHLMKRHRYQTDRNLIIMDPSTNFLTRGTWPEAENAIGFGPKDSVCCLNVTGSCCVESAQRFSVNIFLHNKLTDSAIALGSYSIMSVELVQSCFSKYFGKS